jgi:hypothetical protein
MLYRTSGNHPTDRLEDRIKDLEYKVENLENKLEEKE